MIVKNIEDYQNGVFTEVEQESLKESPETSAAINGNTVTIYQGDEPAPTGPTLAELKQQAVDKVDAETEANILKGFTFAGLTFSMSTNAQINWSNFPSLPSQVFPLSIMSKDDQEYLLSEANKMNFYLSALGYKNTCLQAGNARKKLIMACTTIEQLNGL